MDVIRTNDLVTDCFGEARETVQWSHHPDRGRPLNGGGKMNRLYKSKYFPLYLFALFGVLWVEAGLQSLLHLWLALLALHVILAHDWSILHDGREEVLVREGGVAVLEGVLECTSEPWRYGHPDSINIYKEHNMYTNPDPINIYRQHNMYTNPDPINI